MESMPSRMQPTPVKTDLGVKNFDFQSGFFKASPMSAVTISALGAGPEYLAICDGCDIGGVWKLMES
jgi:hypothetical protein